MTTKESRDRVEGDGASKPEGDREGSTAHQREVPEVRSDPVRAVGQSSTRQSSWRDGHGAKGVKTDITLIARVAGVIIDGRKDGQGMPARFSNVTDLIQYSTQ